MCTPLRLALGLFALPLALPALARAQCEVTYVPGQDPSSAFGWSVSVSGDFALVGAPKANLQGTDSGAAYVFRRQGDGRWAPTQTLIPAAVSAGDQFGISVAVAGDLAIVGAHLDDTQGTDSGAAYVYFLDGDQWTEGDRLLPVGGNPFDWFGYTVSCSGGFAFVGALLRDGNGPGSGSAFSFRRINDFSWTQTGELFASDGMGGDLFGTSVNVVGTRAIVGAMGDDDTGKNSGAAYVFDLGPTGWSESAKLVSDSGDPFDQFGGAVALGNDTALVGAFRDNGSGKFSGAAYMFRNAGGVQWAQVKKLVPLDSMPSDQFGRSIAISGKLAVVGALGKSLVESNAGSAYVFEQSPTAGWVEKHRLVMNLGKGDDGFGYAVAISGQDVFIGAPGHDAGALDAGAASAYRLAGDDPLYACPRYLSVQAGGTQGFELDAGPAHAGDSYWLMGSMSGYSPSTQVGLFTVPLVPDFYTECTVVTPNTAPLSNSLGVLDGAGRALAEFTLPANSSPSLAGAVVHHAFLVFDPADELELVSNAVALELR